MSNLNIGIILGSTREGRMGDQVGAWVLANAKAEGASFELVDLADYPALGAEYQAKIDSFDGFLFITPEYNHSIPGTFKNSLDFIAPTAYNNKPAGIISYGSAGGTRAAEHLRGILGELQVADVRTHVMFSIFTDFEGVFTGDAKFTPAEIKASELQGQIDQLLPWAAALRTVREDAERAAA
ncbi:MULTISPECIES: NAD(P)H-dependent oxidoreductase [unclassified Diaminobutyricimonas]|uniref:NADPH-dependent FMN reductase n=1 Tax=unclassified Diaminobutyricimonas TaxID=2643261 RepID=UPI0012F4862B|nr:MULTISPECIES: NAD(P)H-dependent oxidoreductase [unclassified Diaminobutyricimonas]